MKNYASDINTHPVYDKSPFDVEYTEQRKTIAQPYTQGVDVDTGEVIEMRKLAKTMSIFVDKRPYIRVYQNLFAILDSLSPPGLKVLSYIGQTLGYEKNTITLHPKLICKTFEQNTLTLYYRGVSNLLHFGVIARRKDTKNEYFVNLKMLSNGNPTKAK